MINEGKNYHINKRELIISGQINYIYKSFDKNPEQKRDNYAAAYCNDSIYNGEFLSAVAL
jgi:hypothetical protein